MKAEELTHEERWLYMPKWKKAVCFAFMFVAMAISMVEVFPL